MTDANEVAQVISQQDTSSSTTAAVESIRNSGFFASFVHTVAEMGILNAFVKTIAPVFIVSSPITSYADQIYSMRKSRSSAGFSLDIPLIMLVASITKIFYWFGERYNIALLLQAALMIVVQVLLLKVALDHRPPPDRNYPFASQAPRRPYGFWQWTPSRPYWTVLSGFTASLMVLQIILGGFSTYITLQGYFALAVEAVLPIPQLLANQKRKGCRGFRFSVLANWLIGDAFKMWFFFASGSGEGGVPWAFKLCGLFQAACDLLLGVQYFVYGDGPAEVGAGYGMEKMREQAGRL